MKKPNVTNSLFLNLTLIFLLVGLYSCGEGDNSADDNDTDTEEVIIEIEDEGSANDDTDADYNSDSDADSDVDERKDMDVSSKSKDAELEVELENPGFEGTYNYTEVDVPPTFEECEGKVTTEEQEACFQKFLIRNISGNIKYPESAKKLNVEGTAYIAFVVDKTGVVSQAKVVRGSGYEYEKIEKPINEYIDAYNDLDAAAVEAIILTQKIMPAIVANAPVNVQYTIPVKFEIQ